MAGFWLILYFGFRSQAFERVNQNDKEHSTSSQLRQLIRTGEHTQTNRDDTEWISGCFSI